MDAIERKILDAIDARSGELLEFAEDIFRHPKTGFHEVRTSGKTAEQFRRLGLSVREGLAVTGVEGRLACTLDSPGAHIAVIGELDGIVCRDHPYADAATGCAHACGHHAQLTAMLGAAIALSDPAVRSALCGEISFLAVPAEEYVPDSTRREVESAYGVKFSGSGKSELIRTGVFDTVDIAMTCHVHMAHSDAGLLLGNVAANGFLSKKIIMHGKASHAAIAPWNGINALNAATSGMNMLGLLRETFPDDEHIRVHGILLKGGDAVNVVPEEVVLEEMIRAGSLNAIKRVCGQVNRVFEGAAHAFGAKAEIRNMPGYLPVIARPADPALIDAAELLKEEVSYECATPSMFNGACTDVGDLSHIMPVVNFTHGGFCGSLHASDFAITDPVRAYIIPAKMMALTAYRLLKDHAAEGRKIISEFTPVFTAEEYIHFIEEMAGA